MNIRISRSEFMMDFNQIANIPMCALPEISIPDKHIALYGAGNNICSLCLNILKERGIIPVAICDSSPNKKGTIINGIKIVSLDELLEKYPDINIFISSYKYYDEIRTILLKHIKPSQIISTKHDLEELAAYSTSILFKEYLEDNIERFNILFHSLEDEKSKNVLINVIKGKISCKKEYFMQSFSPEQYFDKEVISFTEKECFIDAGAYTGDTLASFISAVNNKFNSIYCFEPFYDNFHKLELFKQLDLNNDNRIKLYKKGLLDECKTVGFEIEGDVYSAGTVSESASNLIEVISLDSLVFNENHFPTFVKMDIEGSELEALHGARQTIQKYRPKLAICVYHKKEDMLDIYEYIKGLNLNYKFYLRHHSGDFTETVLYAV